jgi:hypothetical protein
MQIQDGQRRQFAAMINAVDDAFLQIVDSLKVLCLLIDCPFLIGLSRPRVCTPTPSSL